MLTIYVVLPFSGFDGAKVELNFETCNIFVCFFADFFSRFLSDAAVLIDYSLCYCGAYVVEEGLLLRWVRYATLQLLP